MRRDLIAAVRECDQNFLWNTVRLKIVDIADAQEYRLCRFQKAEFRQPRSIDKSGHQAPFLHHLPSRKTSPPFCSEQIAV
jgi:hypothetical protein